MIDVGRNFDSEVELAQARIQSLFDAALEAVNPARAVASNLKLSDGGLTAGANHVPMPAGVHVVAIGKAAVAMTRGAFEVLDGVIVSGDVITKEGHADASLPERIKVYEAGHPIPDERGVAATNRALDNLSRVSKGMVVLALVSGGGSALLESPRVGVTLEDLARTTDILLRAGAPIEALNVVRAPLSRVKAGGLRAAAPDAAWITLILSDVLGNDARVIASGPTMPGNRDAVLALQIIDQYGTRGQIPDSVLNLLQASSPPPRPEQSGDDVLIVVGDNAGAVAAAANEASELELNSKIVLSAAQGEASDLGRRFVSLVADALQTDDVLLGGGEATVTVRGNGRGGRNTEFALAAALELERLQMQNWVIASLGTDGQDALTGLAGAMADMSTPQRARTAGIDPDLALRNNDSASVFDVVGGAVTTGPTGTNVNDLYFAVRLRTDQKSSHEEGDL